MGKHNAVAIVLGLAVGAFAGYEFAATLVNYPPYSWIGNYLVGQSSGS